MTTARKQRFLVKCDEQDSSAGIRRILKLQGYGIGTANSGEKVTVEKVRISKPKGITMERTKTGVHGVKMYRLMQPIGSLAFFGVTTVISRLVDNASRKGAVHVLKKPRDPAQTCKLIASAYMQKRV